MAAEPSSEKIGIIAGGGQFPLLFARAVKKEGMEVVVIAHKGESSPELSAEADELYWIRLGQLGKIIKYFKKTGVQKTVLVGPIKKTNIFRDIRPDLKGLSLWNKIDARQDDAILRAVANELENEGIHVVESTRYLKELLFPKGIITKRKPTTSQIDDIKFGWHIAREIGRLDIGQCVVVRNRSVLALEAIEGTDAAIRRGGALGHEKAVIVKVKKPNQDFRFDLPAVGLTTIQTMIEAKAEVLAVEAGQALLFDKDKFLEAANKAKIVVTGVEENKTGELSY